MQKILFIMLLTVLSLGAMAQSKVAKITVQAYIYCDHCKQCESCGQRLENAIYSEKGIKRFDIDEKNKTVSIVYNSAKTNPERLKQAIAKAGFDADDMKGDPEAYATWDNCCQKQ